MPHPKHAANETLSIGLVGDYSASVRAHHAIPMALVLAAGKLACSVSTTWIPTETIPSTSCDSIREVDALWCVPGSPYRSLEGALRAIRFARENAVPFLGTCGGFQHAILEYARNVLDLKGADHAESNPHAELPLISPLACALVEKRGTIALVPGSRVADIYGTTNIEEAYHCSYGLNPAFTGVLKGSQLSFSGFDEAGEVRSLELLQHPFYVCTLYQPELSALNDRVHPLIVEFLSAARDSARDKRST